MKHELNIKYKKAVLSFIAMCSFLLVGLLLGRYVHSYLAFLMFGAIIPAALMSNAIKSVKCSSCDYQLWHCAGNGQSPIYPLTISKNLNYCPNCGVKV
jgi:hypothetical protein